VIHKSESNQTVDTLAGLVFAAIVLRIVASRDSAKQISTFGTIFSDSFRAARFGSARTTGRGRVNPRREDWDIDV
jgi:hypothetical protein